MIGIPLEYVAKGEKLKVRLPSGKIKTFIAETDILSDEILIVGDKAIDSYQRVVEQTTTDFYRSSPPKPESGGDLWGYVFGVKIENEETIPYVNPSYAWNGEYWGYQPVGDGSGWATEQEGIDSEEFVRNGYSRDVALRGGGGGNSAQDFISNGSDWQDDPDRYSNALAALDWQNQEVGLVATQLLPSDNHNIYTQIPSTDFYSTIPGNFLVQDLINLPVPSDRLFEVSHSERESRLSVYYRSTSELTLNGETFTKIIFASKASFTSPSFNIGSQTIRTTNSKPTTIANISNSAFSTAGFAIPSAFQFDQTDVAQLNAQLSGQFSFQLIGTAPATGILPGSSILSGATSSLKSLQVEFPSSFIFQGIQYEYLGYIASWGADTAATINNVSVPAQPGKRQLYYQYADKSPVKLADIALHEPYQVHLSPLNSKGQARIILKLGKITSFRVPKIAQLGNQVFMDNIYMQFFRREWARIIDFRFNGSGLIGQTTYNNPNPIASEPLDWQDDYLSYADYRIYEPSNDQFSGRFYRLFTSIGSTERDRRYGSFSTLNAGIRTYYSDRYLFNLETYGEFKIAYPTQLQLSTASIINNKIYFVDLPDLFDDNSGFNPSEVSLKRYPDAALSILYALRDGTASEYWQTTPGTVPSIETYTPNPQIQKPTTFPKLKVDSFEERDVGVLAIAYLGQLK